MNKKTIVSKSMVLLAQLQLIIEHVEEMETNKFWNGGNLKKRTKFFKEEVDKRLNLYLGGDEETQKQTFSIINELESVYRNIYDQLEEQLKE